MRIALEVSLQYFGYDLHWQGLKHVVQKFGKKMGIIDDSAFNNIHSVVYDHNILNDENK